MASDCRAIAPQQRKSAGRVSYQPNNDRRSETTSSGMWVQRPAHRRHLNAIKSWEKTGTHPRVRIGICQLCPRQHTDSSPPGQRQAPAICWRFAWSCTTTPNLCVVLYAMTYARSQPSTKSHSDAATPGLAARGETTWHARNCHAVAPQQRNSAGRVTTPQQRPPQ